MQSTSTPGESFGDSPEICDLAHTGVLSDISRDFGCDNACRADRLLGKTLVLSRKQCQASHFGHAAVVVDLEYDRGHCLHPYAFHRTIMIRVPLPGFDSM